MTPQLLLSILRARSGIVMFALITTVLTTLIVSMLLPKQYTAKTGVVIDVKSPDPVAGLMLPGLIAPGYMATQLDIITSDRVAQQVVKNLRLEDNPTLRDKWMNSGQTVLEKARRWLEGGDEQRDFAIWLSAGLQDKLEVKPSKESNVVGISFSASNPLFAATVANAFAQAYIDVNVQLRAEPAHQYANWFEGQSKTLRE
ncbi:MAG: chain length determinant protein EpsF, partial [Betaproteobacteria bacterium]|nr:chain length determinant protein EpsF [Betaproteobacteria bacterium]